MSAENGFKATQLAGTQQLLAEQIRTHWTETLEGIVETGRWLTAGRFTKTDYQRYALPFSYSWGRKLIRVSRSPRILDPANRPMLPDKAAALHEIALLTDRLFAQAVREGIIHHQCLVIDLIQFRRSFVEPGDSRRRRVAVVFESRPAGGRCALENLDAFTAAVQTLAESRFPAVIVRRPRTMRDLG